MVVELVIVRIPALLFPLLVLQLLMLRTERIPIAVIEGVRLLLRLLIFLLLLVLEKIIPCRPLLSMNDGDDDDDNGDNTPPEELWKASAPVRCCDNSIRKDIVHIIIKTRMGI